MNVPWDHHINFYTSKNVKDFWKHKNHYLLLFLLPNNRAT